MPAFAHEAIELTNTVVLCGPKDDQPARLSLITASPDREVYTVLGLWQHDVRLGSVLLHRPGGLQRVGRLLTAVDLTETERIIGRAQWDGAGQR